MKSKFLVFVSLVIVMACKSEYKETPLPSRNWDSRKLNSTDLDSLHDGSTYLAVYSDIYSINEHRRLLLTATVSLRNPNKSDTVYIKSAVYYNTNGEKVRDYVDQPIFIAPMETLEIVIPRLDEEGGSGANFIFDWKTETGINEPIFEAAMIHAFGGNYGFAFTTQGIRLE